MTRIISGFPGIGKTHYFNTSTLNVSDSDSSKFSWVSEGTRHPDFPQNYIDHIKGLIGNVDLVLVSSHSVVRDALVANRLEFTLVFPEKRLKAEYIQRFKDRGNAEGFVLMLEKNWDDWMAELEVQEDCETIRLKSGEFLSDYLEQKE